MKEKNYKFQRKCPVKGCTNIITYSRKDSYKSALIKNTKCGNCSKIGMSKNLKFNNTEYYDKIISIYYNKNKTLKNIANELKISFTTLLKIIKLYNLPKIKRDIKSFDRKKSYIKGFKKRYNITYDEHLKNKTEFYKYKSKVKYYTNKTLKYFGHAIENFDRVGRGDDGYHIDHIVSIKDCFLKNVDPQIVSSFINLRSVPKKVNLSKGSKSLYDVEILILNSKEKLKILI